MPNQVFIIEDQRDLALALTMVFNLEPDYYVCGVANDVTEAIEKFEASGAEFVTVDIHLPGGSGLELIPKLIALRPAARFLVFSNEDPYVFAPMAKKQGAAGYLRKGAPPSSLIEVANAIMSGEDYFPGVR